MQCEVFPKHPISLSSHTHCKVLRARCPIPALCWLKCLLAWPHAFTSLPRVTASHGFPEAVTCLSSLIGICPVACGGHELNLINFIHQQAYGVIV